MVRGQLEQSGGVLPRATSGPEEFIRRKAELCRSGFQMLDKEQSATEDALFAQP